MFYFKFILLVILNGMGLPLSDSTPSQNSIAKLKVTTEAIAVKSALRIVYTARETLF